MTSDQEVRTQVVVERITLSTERPFDDVLAAIYDGVSRPDLAAAATAWLAASSFQEFENVVADNAGPAGLIQFLRLDQGSALAKVPGTEPRRMLRLLLGNPVTMTRMARTVPAAGSYVPVTVLLWQDGGTVRIAYDTMASLLAPYEDEQAHQVARELDSRVLALLRSAATAGGR